MGPRPPEEYLACAESAWRWVLDQVRDDDGPWIPWQVDGTEHAEPPGDRDGMHSGIAGLGYVLDELRLLRPWTVEEQDLAHGIAHRLRRAVAEGRDCSYFDGHVALLGVSVALRESSSHAAVRRLLETAGPDGWPLQHVGDERIAPGAPGNDLTLGTAGVLLGAVWGLLHGVAESEQLAHHAAGVLAAEAEPAQVGVTWGMVPPRYVLGSLGEMPNLSHGVAGVATALALAGRELGRPDLVALASEGAAHLISLGRVDGRAFTVPQTLRPGPLADDPPAFGWCHGSAGTSLLFLALARAGVEEVAGEPPLAWHRSCLEAVRLSGLPARLRPGFWDNDGRCCGTAGVGDILLDSWQRGGADEDLRLALRLADALLERAVHAGSCTSWRFVEHRAAEPLLPPGVGWMQGAAGIAAYLFRVGRVLREGRECGAARRMDNWWAVERKPGPQAEA